MLDLLGPGTSLGYCTNVHAGATYEQVLHNLERYALAVKHRVCPDTPMGVGLWLSGHTARQLIEEDRIEAFAQWLNERSLVAFTLNGFPFGDFHRRVVKHDVYEPDWRDPRRVQYTLDLVTVLAGLVVSCDPSSRSATQGESQKVEGSLSTLPVGWRGGTGQVFEHLDVAVENLLNIVDHLARLEQETGRLIHLDLEPEPGCVLQTSQDVVDLFRNHLDPVGEPLRIRRYLRVCHDTCHAAVMFEPHDHALMQYEQAGIRIGKVQLSSAVCVDFDALQPQDRTAAYEQLARFQEDRYLHQTVVRTIDRFGSVSHCFYEDLPGALAAWDTKHAPTGQWRVHFHVPLFLDRIGWFKTTHDQVLDCLALIKKNSGVHHFEVETYAWDVLPNGVTQRDLAKGIAQELIWLTQHTSLAGARR